MPTYSCGREAQCGDVVRRTSVARWDERFSPDGTYAVLSVTKNGYITIRGSADSWDARYFELIRRQGETMNGKYASGEEPQVGDEVQCVDGSGLHQCVTGGRYMVERVGFFAGRIRLAQCHPGYEYPPHYFKLIQRQEQPMPDPKPEPLVKWPESDLWLEDLQQNELFVLVSHPEIPCVKFSGIVSSFARIDGKPPGELTVSGNPKVRRIRFNPANKEPVFEVI